MRDGTSQESRLIVLDGQALRRDPDTGRLSMQSLGPAKTREIESALCSRLRR